MHKHSPSRNQRSKGIKVKHVLQICLLVALCCWLIYQLKHYHDKRREFDDSAKVSLATQQKDGVVKLGRKYLNPQTKDKVIETSKQDEEEEEEEETAVEEEDNKHEEMEEQDDIKIDEKEEEEEEEDVDEGRGGGEEIDDNDQEKSDTDNDQEVDFVDNVDNEKERENVDEQELEDKDAEDDKGRTENDSASREYYKEVGGATNTREAREENYKADDASSAVTHHTQIATTDNQTTIMQKSNQKAEVSEFDHQKNQTKSINSDETPMKVEGGETANNSSHLGATATSNMTKGFKNHKNSNNLNAVRIEPRDEDVVEGHKNARFQALDYRLEGNSTLPDTNDQHNVSLTINIDSKDKDPSLREPHKSGVTESSISKMWSNVSANMSGKSEEAFDDTKDNRGDGIDEKFDESNSDASDELEVDLIDSSDSTNSLEENYI